LRKNRFITCSHYLFLFLFLILTLFPFYQTLINSLKYRMEIVTNFWGWPTILHMDNFATAFQYLWPMILNSLFITSCIVLGVLFISTTAAYSFSRFEFPGKEILYFLVIMLYMIPGFLLLVPQFILIKNMGLLNTYAGQIFPPLTVGSTVATILMREFFGNIPKSLFESAEIEGARNRTIYSRIVIPLSLPVISVVAILNAMSGWNNYIWPLVIVSDASVKPVILALGNIPGNVKQGLGLQLAGYVIASIPLLILFSIASRSFVAGLTAGSIKG
jgi:ABC-type glycerol-3-phosphate transport system permease component